MKTVVIIGGGITGLAAAYYMQKAIEEGMSLRVILVEAEETLGGKISTYDDSGFLMETGADSIVARKTNVAPFLEELGLQDQVVYNATGKSFIYSDQELRPIPSDTIFGIPLSIESLAKSNLVSAEGKVEALKDFYTTNESFTKTDSIGRFLMAFLGEELVEKQIAPVISGVYSGKLEELTIASTMPYLLEYKNKYGSIIQGLYENRKQFQGAGDKKFLSFSGGMSALIDGLESRLTQVEIIKGIKAEQITKQEEGRYQLTLVDGRSIETDYIVLSTLHTAAQALLRSEQLDEEFRKLTNSSLISVYLGFDIPDSRLPKDGTGFIVSGSGDVECNACTWTSRKWEHTSSEQQLLVRLFYKSSNPKYQELLQLPEDELVQVALRDITASLGITEQPVTRKVTVWHETMPNYHIQHHDTVRALEQKLAQSDPNIVLAGCSYYGVGIPDCIANGEKTAKQILDQLR
jgi:protoporphyrinogen/coproporphyrinogen III oxidase